MQVVIYALSISALIVITLWAKKRLDIMQDQIKPKYE